MGRTLARAAAFVAFLLVTLLLAIVGTAAVTIASALFLVVRRPMLALGVYCRAGLANAARLRRRLARVTLAVLTVAGGFSMLWPETGPAPAEFPGM